ncbi:MAG: DUF3341 domain-containing protein [Chloroflexi bacterium]|nr:MAG: DUF3341 domain-containing protein [Chloroflexota bacterium]
MADTVLVVGSFRDIDPTVAALDRLDELGIPEENISVLSHLPLSERVLGRPHVRSWLPAIALVSAALGLVIGLFFVGITPHLYIIRVGGQPIVPFPPSALLLYEFIMLALILGTFGSFLVLNRFPDRRPEPYDVELTTGRIALVVEAPADLREDVIATLEELGAEDIGEPERRSL